MTKPEIILDAGKRLAATASGRAFHKDSPAASTVDLVDDKTSQKRTDPAAKLGDSGDRDGVCRAAESKRGREVETDLSAK